MNKFLGDGFMAVFGAPLSDGEDSRNAVAASCEILDRVEAEVTAGTIPPTRIGIGLHAGEAVTGNVGSAQRKEYTIIGDVVNLASRIEQLNKTFHAQLLLSEEVWQAIQTEDAAHASQHDPTIHEDVRVKGRDEPVRIYQLV